MKSPEIRALASAESQKIPRGTTKRYTRPLRSLRFLTTSALSALACCTCPRLIVIVTFYPTRPTETLPTLWFLFKAVAIFLFDCQVPRLRSDWKASNRETMQFSFNVHSDKKLIQSAYKTGPVSIQSVGASAEKSAFITLFSPNVLWKEALRGRLPPCVTFSPGYTFALGRSTESLSFCRLRS